MASYQAIKSKIVALEKAAQVALKKESASVIKRIHALMSEYGINHADLRVKPASKEKAAVGKTRGRKPKSVAKYRNPETDQTWSGRGKPPAWMVGPRKQGTADQFLIANTSAAKATGKATAKPRKTAKKKAKSAPVKKVTASKPAKKVATKKPRVATKSKNAKAKKPVSVTKPVQAEPPIAATTA